MAKKVYIVEFDAKGEAYLRTLNEMEKRTVASSKRMDDAFGRVKNSIAGLVTVAGTLAFVKSSIDKFIESQRTLEKLERAFGKLSDSTKKWIDEMELASRFGDEEIKSAMSRIGSYVKEESMLKKLTEAVMDFAAAKEMDLTEAAELVTKSIISNTNSLSRYGIQLDATAAPLVKVNQLLEQFNLFQGEAKLKTDSQVDSMIRLRKEMENVQEDIGKKALPIQIFFYKVVDNALSEITKLWDVFTGKRPISDYGIPASLLDQIDAIRESGNRRAAEKLKFNFINGKTFDFDLARQQVLTSIGGVVGSDLTNNENGKGRRLNTNIDELARFYDIDSRGIPPMMEAPKFMAEQFAEQMKESMAKTSGIDDLVKQWTDEWAQEFNTKFYAAVDIAHQVESIFNIAADTFVGKLISGVEVAAQILGLINSLNILFGAPAPAGPALAQGGTVINRNGNISITPIPQFAGGGSFMVPPGYSRDNYPIMVKSGERVDVTPVNQMPTMMELLKQINSSIQASTKTSMRAGGKPIIVNLQLDGRSLTKAVLSNQNRLGRAGQNFDEL